jgi:hypothetical protein
VDREAERDVDRDVEREPVRDPDVVDRDEDPERAAALRVVRRVAREDPAPARLAAAEARLVVRVALRPAERRSWSTCLLSWSMRRASRSMSACRAVRRSCVCTCLTVLSI